MGDPPHHRVLRRHRGEPHHPLPPIPGTEHTDSPVQAFYTSLSVDPAAKHPRIDRRPGKAHLYRNGTVLIRPYARRLRELVEYAAPLLALDLVLVKKFAGVPRETIIRSGGYPLPSSVHANSSMGRWVRDGVTQIEIRPTWKVPTLHHFSWASPVQLTRALPLGAPSSREITLGIVTALFLYDFYFYLPHIALHKVGACLGSEPRHG